MSTFLKKNLFDPILLFAGEIKSIVRIVFLWHSRRRKAKPSSSRSWQTHLNFFPWCLLGPRSCTQQQPQVKPPESYRVKYLCHSERATKAYWCDCVRIYWIYWSFKKASCEFADSHLESVRDRGEFHCTTPLSFILEGPLKTQSDDYYCNCALASWVSNNKLSARAFHPHSCH